MPQGCSLVTVLKKGYFCEHAMKDMDMKVVRFDK